MDEIFKDIPGYDGRYQISNKGSVVSHTLPIWLPHLKKKQIRKNRNNKLYVTLTREGVGHSNKRLISALVLESFGCPKPNRVHIPYYKDGNSHNCELSNLYWALQPMPWSNPNYKPAKSGGNFKLTNEQVKEIRTLLSKGEKQRAIAKMFNVHESTISYIKNGKRRPPNSQS